jgi:hypothetical protein
LDVHVEGRAEKKPSMDEQFAQFMDVIQNIHINIPLKDAMRVPTYARYLKDILNNKRSLPTTEMIKLTEECSNAIPHRLPEKKDPGCPTISCSIRTQHFDQALCDLGASVSIMPKDIFDRLNYTVLIPTPMRLQLADSSVRYPAGIAEDVPVKIRDFFVPVDFVVLKMDSDKKTPLILGRPFLSTAEASIDVGARNIRFHINGKDEKFDFRPRAEQCSMVKIKYSPNARNIKEVEVQPRKMNSLIAFMKKSLEIEPTMKRPRPRETPTKTGVQAKAYKLPLVLGHQFSSAILLSSSFQASASVPHNQKPSFAFAYISCHWCKANRLVDYHVLA